MSGYLFKTTPGTVLLNVLIPNTRFGTVNQTATDTAYHPHPVDFYIPSGPITFSCVILHGGTSTKAQIARDLKISWGTAATTNWAMLSFWQCIAVFPQGQHCHAVDEAPFPAAGIVNDWNPRGVNSVSTQYPNGVSGWYGGGFMWTQVDDLQFLKDLATYIQATYGAIGRTLAGHSAGGLMAQYVWTASALSYGHYCSISGPQSGHLLDTPLPAVKRPIFTWYSDGDTNLGISGGMMGAGDHFYEDTWRQDPGQVAQVDVDFPAPATHIGGYKSLVNRVAATSGETVSVGAAVTTTTDAGHEMLNWKFNIDKLWLRLIRGIGHSLVDQQAAFGHNIFNQWMLFSYTT